MGDVVPLRPLDVDACCSATKEPDLLPSEVLGLVAVQLREAERRGERRAGDPVVIIVGGGKTLQVFSTEDLPTTKDVVGSNRPKAFTRM